ncbi:hypothetical protein V2W45_1465870 [Cenococcum geophilum]
MASPSLESKYVDLKTDEASSSTDLTDVNIYSNKDNNNRLNTFNKAEYIKEDYKPSRKGGRRRRRTKKVYRLIYKRAISAKLNSRLNRNIYKVLRKLAKKYSLKKTGLEKPYIYIEDLIKDLEGGPYRILLEFTFKFIKEYLSIKDINTFLIPKIIYNPFLTFSPYIFLLSLLFAN